MKDFGRKESVDRCQCVNVANNQSQYQIGTGNIGIGNTSTLATLSSLPKGWEVRKMKFTFVERKQKGFPELPLLAATQNHGVILKSKYENRTVEATKALGTLKLVEPGDFVISLRSFQGGLEIAYDRGIISPAYTILVPTHITREYFKYYAKSPEFISILRSTVTGIREGQNIDYNRLREYYLEIPSVGDQIKMGEYLDAETVKIDKAIAAEEKMIALLQERREIIINDAVGGGEGFNAEPQSCGARRGWKTKPLRAFLRPRTVRGMPDAQLLSVTREAGVIVRDVTSKEENHNYIPDDLSNYKFVKSGQFVINKMKAWQGSYGVSPCDGLVSPAYFVYDLSFPCKEFFNRAIRSKFYVPYFQRHSKGIRIDQWDLMPEALKALPFAFPPLPEQERIVKYLDAETGKIDRAIEVKRRQIALLRERREIVINEVVTGKVKVA